MSGRYALIVANDEYDDPKLRQLRAPSKDAETLARVLGDPQIGDFNVDLATNEPQHLLRKKVNRFLEGRCRDDTVLLHFSCHGLKNDSGQLFFAARDTEVDYLEDSALESGWLRRRIDSSRSKRIVLLLDCCFSGAFSGEMVSRAGDAAHPMEPLGGTGTVVLTASSALEFSWEGNTLSGEPTPSVFTSGLVRGLETGEADLDCDQRIAIGELYEYVYQKIKESGAKQTPGMNSSVHGELIVAKSRRQPAPVPLPQEIADVLDSPVMHVRMAVIEPLTALLQKGGRFAPAARQALEQLRDDPDSSARVSGEARAALADDRLDVPLDQPCDSPTTVSLAHDDAVMALAFSADGRWLATACRDQTARVWDVANAAEHRRFAHDDWVTAAELSPDAGLLATACRDRAARLWHVESGRQLSRLAHDGVVWSVTFSPDGRLLATAGADATVRLWDVDDGSERESISHDAPIVALRFSADGRLLATASSAGFARVWDLEAGSEHTHLAVPDPVRAVSFDRDQRALAASVACDTAHVWDVADGRGLVRVDHERIHAVAFSGHWRCLLTAGGDGTVRIWEINGGRELAAVDIPSAIRATALAPDGARLAVAGSDRSVSLLSVARYLPRGS